MDPFLNTGGIEFSTGFACTLNSKLALCNELFCEFEADVQGTVEAVSVLLVSELFIEFVFVMDDN